MGGHFSDNFKKSTNPILITPLPEGKKYEAAILWKLPALRCEWLMDCYKMKKRVMEEPYLVGISKPSKKNFVVEIPENSMSSPPPAAEVSSFQQDNLFKRPSISERTETENEEIQVRNLTESNKTLESTRESDIIDQDLSKVHQNVEMTIDKEPESPVRRSPRNRASFVVDESELLDQGATPELRHKRIDQLVNRKSLSPATPNTPSSASMPTPERLVRKTRRMSKKPDYTSFAMDEVLRSANILSDDEQSDFD